MTARKDISFFSGTKQDIERKRRMAQALMEAGKQPDKSEIVSGLVVPRSPLEGLAKALQQGVGGYISGQADRQEAQKEQNAQQTLADAVGSYTRSMDQTPTKLSNGDTIKWNKPNIDRSANMYANILMGNPDTAPIGMQSVMGNIEAQQNQARELDTYKQKMPLELELLKQKYALEAQAPITPYQQAQIEMEKEKMARQVDATNLPKGYIWEDGQAVLAKGLPETFAKEDRDLKATEMKEFWDQDAKIAASADAISQLQRMGALNTEQGTYEGIGASARAYGGSLFGNEAALNTLEIDNLAKGLAASILKSTFGGMPTEGERKFLVDLQGSANKTVAERQRIIDNGIAMINNRINQAQKTQEKIKTGDYSPTQPMITNLGQIRDGARAVNDAGQVIVFRNGQWMPE